MMAEEISDKQTVVLGFLEEAESWRLLAAQFPSKVGGKPAWLSPVGVPAVPDLVCEKCQQTVGFLLQVYAPVVGLKRSFHRTLYVFCCRTPECYTQNDNRCFKVFRSQLPRKNDFYPYNPPPDDEPADCGDEDRQLSSGVKLCWLCGCPGEKSCSRCHSVTYCSKEHQTIDWKQRHKKECSSGAAPSTSHVPNSFLFPEWELVTEPESLPVQAEESLDSACVEQVDCASSELEEKELESMALHETQDSKVFQKFKERVAAEPEQVLRYCRQGSPLWVSSEHVPSEVPKCQCGADRNFEFQIMPQLLNHLKVDQTGASIDWGTLAVYTCAESCDQGNKYTPEFIWKQDFSEDQKQ